MKTTLALVLSLVAAVPTVRAATPAHLDDGLKVFLQGYARSPVSPADPTLRASIATVDLGGDGVTETLVYLSGQDWCGTGGCPLLVLRRDGPSFKIISKTTITRPPIRILPTRSHGWSDLGVTVVGGGITRAYVARLPFDGSRYARNPTMPPASHAKGPQGMIAISANDPGEPLFP
jgi:hypothetical protein